MRHLGKIADCLGKAMMDMQKMEMYAKDRTTKQEKWKNVMLMQMVMDH